MKKLSFNGLALLASLIFVQATWTNAWANNGCPAFDLFGNISCNSVASDASCYKPCDYNLTDNCTTNCQSSWVIGGWTEAGLFVNEYGQKNSYNANGFKPWSGNTSILNNVRQSDLQVNQSWLYFGKELTSCSGFQVGGRVDFMYGTDGRFLQSDGFERKSGRDPWGDGDYYAAFPQAYVEIGNKVFNVKAGKFLGLLGYESGMSPNRFFYSLSHSYAIVPATMTGAVATWNLSNQWSFFGGWTSGRNSSFESSQDSDIVGGFKYQVTKRFSIGYGMIVGREQGISFTPKSDVYVNSLVLNYKPTDRLNYTFAWNLQNQTDKPGDGHWGVYTLTNELTYRLNRCWTIGGRVEWAKLHAYGLSEELTDLSFGANWTPTSWLLVRPELRYDSVQGFPAFNLIKGVPSKDQISGGFSCIVKY